MIAFIVSNNEEEAYSDNGSIRHLRLSVRNASALPSASNSSELSEVFREVLKLASPFLPLTEAFKVR